MSRLAALVGAGEGGAALARALDARGEDFAVILWDQRPDPAMAARARAHIAESGNAGLAKISEALQAARADGYATLTAIGRPPHGGKDWEDNVLSFIERFTAMTEAMGWDVRAPCDVVAEMGIEAGPLDADFAPDEAQRRNLARAWRAAGAVGALGEGQAAAASRVILGFEIIDGTDAMLRRVGELPASVRAGGVLVKRPMPGQNRRVDLPAIGEETLRAVAAAGLCGVGLEAGGAVALDRAKVAARARALGLWVYGVSAAEGARFDAEVRRIS